MKYQALTPVQTLQLENEKAKIEKEVKRITYSVEIGKDLAKLRKDPKFIKVFDEFYLKEEVVRETMLLSEKYFLEEDQRQSLLDGLISKSYLNDWMTATVSMEALSASRLAEHATRLREINSLLTSGIPETLVKATPPEGVPNAK